MSEEDLRGVIKRIIVKVEKKESNKVKRSLIENKKGYRRGKNEKEKD